jgi:hypothetical protein
LEVEKALVLLGLGRLQDLLEEGVLVVASCYDCLVLRGRGRSLVPYGMAAAMSWWASSLTTS